MSNPIKRPHLAAAMLSLLPGLALGHETSASSVTTLEPVVVTGKSDGSLTVPGVQAAHDQIESTPGGVDLVSSEEYQDRYALNIKDVLRGTPGVYAQQRFAEEVRLSIRGSGLGRSNHVRGLLLLQDGVPINLADGFGDFQEIDPLNYRYVEVYKGANGLRYGSSTLGGAINFVTPTGRTAAQQNLVRLEGGSYDTYREHVSVARAYDQLDFYAGVTANQAKGFRDQSETDNQRFNGNVGYQFGNGVETRFYLNWNDIDQQIPGTVSLASALNDPQAVLPTAKSFDTGRDVESLRLANKTSFKLGGGQLDAGAYYFRKKLHHPITGIVIVQDGDFYGAFAQWSQATQIGGLQNELSLGVNARLGDNDALVFANNGGHRGAKSGDAVEKAVNYDVYAENRLWLKPDLALIAGIQAVQAERDYTDNLNAAESADKTYKAANPRLGVLWNLRPQAQLFANISRSYEPPVFGDLNQNTPTGAGGFVPLAAQRAWTAEVGARGQHQRWAWDLSVYRAELDREMLQMATSPTASIQFNADRTIHQGVEAGLAFRIADGLLVARDTLTLQQTYTWSDFHFDGDATYGSNQLAGQPEHYYLAELRYQHPAGFFVAPGLERATGNVVDYANTQSVPAYTVWNLSTGVTLPHGVSLFLDGRNLLDERYVSSVTSTTNFSTAANKNLFYPGEGRVVYGGVRWAF